MLGKPRRSGDGSPEGARGVDTWGAVGTAPCVGQARTPRGTQPGWYTLTGTAERMSVASAGLRTCSQVRRFLLRALLARGQCESSPPQTLTGLYNGQDALV